MTSFTRRHAIKSLTVGSSAVALSTPSAEAAEPSAQTSGFASAWHEMNDRVWLGADFWANPMEDWRIVDGAAECQTGGGDRNIHLITHQLTNADAEFQMSVKVEQVEVFKKDGGAGFSVGIKSELNEFRSNSFSKGGIDAGVADGKMVLGRKSLELPADK